MVPKYIVPVVEGKGEISSAPELLRRILYERMGLYHYVVGKAVCAKGEGKLTKELERFVGYAFGSTPHAIIVIRDAEEDCAKTLAASFASRCRAMNVPVPIAVVCPVMEFENWFLASVETVVKGSSATYTDPDSVRDAKGHVKKLMPGKSYRPTRHQTSLTSQIDLELAFSHSRSFRRMCHALEEIANGIDTQATFVSPSLG